MHKTVVLKVQPVDPRGPSNTAGDQVGSKHQSQLGPSVLYKWKFQE